MTFQAAVLLLTGLTAARADAPELRKGPWLMDVRPDGVVVLTELVDEAPLEVVVRDGSGAEVARFASAAHEMHEIAVRGLQPATRYAYEVRSGATSLARSRFTTAPRPGEGPIRFVVYGDSRDDAVAHLAVVRAVRAEAPDFVLSTGDVVGRGDEPGDWQEFFQTTAALVREVPLFPLLGNHELVPPDNTGLPHYRRWMRAPADDGPTPEADYAFQYGPARFVVINDRQDFRPGTPARAWLEARLEEAASDATARHLIVAMHHGLFSSGRHGENEAGHAAGLPELFRRHRVSIIFSGHDHAFERGEADGLKYVVSGGGGAVLYPYNTERPYQLAFDPVFHYARVEIDGDRVEVTAIKPDGTTIDRCAFTGRDPWHCPRPAGAATSAEVRPGAGRVVSTGEGFARIWYRTGLWIIAGLLAFVAVGWWIFATRVRRRPPRRGGRRGRLPATRG